MKPRISPTGTLRAVSGLRAAASALLFLLGVLFAALWLLSAPAQAETGSNPLGNLGLERVDEVTEPVTTPVTDTLGTVHQRVEQGAGEAAASAIALPEPAVTEVRDEVRGVVTEIDRTREETADQGLVPALVEPVASARSGTGPVPEESTTSAEPDSPDPSKASVDEGTEVTEDPIASGPLRSTAADHRAIAPAHGSEPAEALTGDPIDPPEVQATAGSAISSANAPTSAPAAVAGYLATAALPGPDVATALVRAGSPHATPADPADDPTVSPD
ncbi:hypothetical protein [Nocardiopsis sp. JB363]|uniref:hypothetical protein n=1 Tax=Nocardiopsis sp. JB363 TaxID=1434837 RepID=UPI000979D20C|nr:hypothetical protein [Nocardiopsis sp. JB363]SIO90480.1 hypothetical protein BQ8420_26865 [Nocardiopsis sp. JB363]